MGSGSTSFTEGAKAPNSSTGRAMAERNLGIIVLLIVVIYIEPWTSKEMRFKRRLYSA
jgi:hypothetical protein